MGKFSCRFLFNEALLPICSPGYLNENLTESTATRHRLLVAEDNPYIWDEWNLATNGSLLPANITMLGDHSLLTQEAINNHGVALLDKNLLSHQLKLGLLVALADMPQWETGQGWYLVFEERVAIEECLTALIDWLLHEADIAADGSTLV